MKYSPLFSAAIRNSCWRTRGGGGRLQLADHPGPTFGGHISRIIFNDGRMRKISPCLTHIAPMSIGVKAIIANHDLSLIGNMGSDSGDEVGLKRLGVNLTSEADFSTKNLLRPKQRISIKFHLTCQPFYRKLRFISVHKLEENGEENRE